MKNVRLEKIAGWCKGKSPGKTILKKSCRGISTDTRTIKKGELFIALKGGNFDGSRFVDAALEKGAAAAIAGEDYPGSDKKIIRVKDSLKALGDIARGYRKEFNAYVIGITGSDGKTTTKEFLKRTLSARYNVRATEGNFNNQIGLPLSIFNIDKETDFCILEMGMNRKNELRYLGKIAEPQAGVITNTASAHMGFFKNGREIAEAKSELIETLRGERFCMLNYDNKFFGFFMGKTRGETLSFGLGKGADVRGVVEETGNDFFIFSVEGERFRINFWNISIIYPALVSVGFGRKFGIKGRDMADAFEGIKPLPGRGLIHSLPYITIIDETYNCNPNSLKSALCNFAAKNFRRKITVIGDMGELGRFSSFFHRNAGLLLKKLDIDRVITFGEKSRITCEAAGSRCKHFNDADEVNKHLSKILKKGDAVLVKGSRMMKMERIVNYLINK
ncbi:MAG: UDP-N-acetylmuramoyl-tripeptide--D-alanyl-D-alanine ligase [Candidatus Omnitrophica bacterium]|nr:UDP-N-acetylmuramoyl-tripeptide--D-alanyl-D-alanine ligase [Candidatus Omnitrophota bacterium]